MEILEFMQEIVREEGKTLIMVSHDMEVAMYAGRIVHMLDGKITSIEEIAENINKLKAQTEGKRRNMKKRLAIFLVIMVLCMSMMPVGAVLADTTQSRQRRKLRLCKKCKRE